MKADPTEAGVKVPLRHAGGTTPQGRLSPARAARLLLEAPHRPLFLLAALCGAAGSAVWLRTPESGEAAGLHVGLFLGGMAQAAVTGYLLTALPGWTRTARFGTGTSALFTLLFLVALARLLGLVDGPAWLAALPAAAVGATAFIRFLAGGGWRRAAVLPLLALMGAGWAGLPEDAAVRPVPPVVAVFALGGLIALVGGRALPAFGRFWLKADGAASGHVGHPAWGIGVLVAAGAMHAAGEDRLAGTALALSGCLLLLACRGWPWRIARRYGALMILYLSWLWLPAGLILAGTTLALPETPILPHQALHALAAGAIATMIYGFMARAAMRREGGRLRLGARLGTGYALMSLSALLRLFLADPAGQPGLLSAAAGSMCLGWLLFLAAYLPSLARPSPRPVFSAARAG